MQLFVVDVTDKDGEPVRLWLRARSPRHAAFASATLVGYDKKRPHLAVPFGALGPDDLKRWLRTGSAIPSRREILVRKLFRAIGFHRAP